jgi:hypothetical protein
MLSAAIDLQPTLVGQGIYLRSLTLDDHDALYQVANDPLVCEQHPSPLRYKHDVFDAQIFSTGLVLFHGTLITFDVLISSVT